MKINPDIFKAYDIRGVYGQDFDETTFYSIACVYAEIFKPVEPVIVSYDVRLSSPSLQKAVIDGLTDSGVDVVDIGLASTEMYYFAVGQYKMAGGLMITASHNPQEYNGLKMVAKDVVPIHKDNGIFQIRDMVVGDWLPTPALRKGSVVTRAVLDDFCDFAVQFLDESAKVPQKIVINPNFGFEGEVVKRFVQKNNLPWQLIGLNDLPDGTFPKGRPDPFVPENRPEFVALTKSTGADFGVAWDADADRVFFCDDQGRFIESYYINNLLIKSLLADKPNEIIVYDPRYTWALIDAAKSVGAKAVMERVGHSYIKESMRHNNAIFAGESSGHTYFRDFWYADSGLLPVLVLVNLLAKAGQPLSELIQPVFDQYPMSGELNSTVADVAAVLARIESKYADGKIEHFDGLSIEFSDWRFSLRSSNTEPLLRLNIEARTEALVTEKVAEMLAIIRS
ncbi:MAG: phosphomannomutase/phosphoglucomutase [Candidatus Falkowbacteria bacterium]